MSTQCNHYSSQETDRYRSIYHPQKTPLQSISAVSDNHWFLFCHCRLVLPVLVVHVNGMHTVCVLLCHASFIQHIFYFLILFYWFYLFLAFFLDLSMYVSKVCSFLLLKSIPLYGYAIKCLSYDGIWINSSLGLFG